MDTYYLSLSLSLSLSFSLSFWGTQKCPTPRNHSQSIRIAVNALSYVYLVTCDIYYMQVKLIKSSIITGDGVSLSLGSEIDCTDLADAAVSGVQGSRERGRETERERETERDRGVEN